MQYIKRNGNMARTLIMMGVSGCGKSAIGSKLAAYLGCRFVEGDALHAPASVAKMAAGTPLDDADRHGWLLRLQAIIAQAQAADETIVVSCSALKRRYRQLLREGDATLFCIHLQARRALLEARMQSRRHFMPVSLLESQLRDLEPLASDERGMCVEVDADTASQAVVATIASALESHQ